MILHFACTRLKWCFFSNIYIQGVPKKCPNWKIPYKLDIPHNLKIVLLPRVVRRVLVYLAQKNNSKVNLCFQGGAFYRLVLKWLARKNVTLKMWFYLTIGTSMKGANKLSKFQKKWCLSRATRATPKVGTSSFARCFSKGAVTRCNLSCNLSRNGWSWEMFIKAFKH